MKLLRTLSAVLLSAAVTPSDARVATELGSVVEAGRCEARSAADGELRLKGNRRPFLATFNPGDLRRD